MRNVKRLVGAALLAAAFAGPAVAAPVDLLGDALLAQTSVPECSDGSVLGEVQSRFAAGAWGMLRQDIQLTGLEKVYQTYPTITRPSPVARRYCAAQGWLTDGRRAPVYFMIEHRLGFVGAMWNVESCVIGYEPWRVHDGKCRTVRKWW